MELRELKKKFENIYGAGEMRVFHSPGRVNLIGEHIDYNGGYVFPCAIELGTYGIVRERCDNKINFVSTNFKLKVETNVDELGYRKEDDWANYPKGVISIMKNKGYKVGGMDILISGNIPNGSGLSSSASLELLIGEMINRLFNEGEISKIDLVKIAQEAENKFVGVNCGIMDQFAVGMGKASKGILLNCNTLEYKYAPVDLKDYTLVIMNTKKRRELNESKYNKRREECEKALEIIKTKKNIKYLCELTPEEFKKVKEIIEDEDIRKRAEHAVLENYRVKDAFRKLSEGNLQEFGKLLVESHNSLKNLYEVTGKELDTIVYEALKIEGCIGARMTGAGFGGCAIAIVHKDDITKFMKKLKESYFCIIGYYPEFYVTGIGEGSREI
ncbi:galactokinase [Haloimpatiens massiliensis]|uniref:galactokinase n=1 Tax=Haloimpatiens massiliensis TaxID=1658110 RepID=UPI000C820EEE|nr:galactokinase [Haloimpatiens massiliensis]